MALPFFSNMLKAIVFWMYGLVYSLNTQINTQARYNTVCAKSVHVVYCCVIIRVYLSIPYSQLFICFCWCGKFILDQSESERERKREMERFEWYGAINQNHSCFIFFYFYFFGSLSYIVWQVQ